MERYQNLSGGSGVIGYELNSSSITVQFSDGWYYLYTAISTSQENIAEMHRLALNGRGLNSYINRIVRKGWEKKWQ